MGSYTFHTSVISVGSMICNYYGMLAPVLQNHFKATLFVVITVPFDVGTDDGFKMAFGEAG